MSTWSFADPVLTPILFPFAVRLWPHQAQRAISYTVLGHIFHLWPLVVRREAVYCSQLLLMSHFSLLNGISWPDHWTPWHLFSVVHNFQPSSCDMSYNHMRDRVSDLSNYFRYHFLVWLFFFFVANCFCSNGSCCWDCSRFFLNFFFRSVGLLLLVNHVISKNHWTLRKAPWHSSFQKWT